MVTSHCCLDAGPWNRKRQTVKGDQRGMAWSGWGKTCKKLLLCSKENTSRLGKPSLIQCLLILLTHSCFLCGLQCYVTLQNGIPTQPWWIVVTLLGLMWKHLEQGGLRADTGACDIPTWKASEMSQLKLYQNQPYFNWHMEPVGPWRCRIGVEPPTCLRMTPRDFE